MGRYGLKKWSAFAALSLVVSCAQDSGTVGNTDVVITNDPNKVVCTPFDNGDPALASNGLVGNLLYLSDDQPRYSRVADYMNNAHKVDVNLYLNKLYTPTRPFDLGFVTKSGILVKDQTGDTLYEYFALHMESFLQLRDSDPEGDYQIALLADDGAILQVNDSPAGFTTLVDNDGTHPTKMACATRAVHMTRDSKIPIKVDYYQGPRYHIALTMIWRPMPASPADPLCGQSGNSKFWDSTQNPSSPTGFNDLLARGWTPLATQNFLLPTAMGSENPCAQQGPVEISNFSIMNVSSTEATLQWDTNIPADSTVYYRIYMPDGDQPWSQVTDASMLTGHSMNISGLRPFTLYEVYVSSSAGASSASNSISTFRTLR